MGHDKTHNRFAVFLSPKQSEPQRAALKIRVQGGALRFFPPAFL